MEIKYRANPNARDSMSTQKIMLRLTIGLLVVYAFGLYHAFTLGKAYLINAIILMVVAVVAALATETIWALATKEKNILDYLKNSFGWVTAIILVLTVTYDTHPYAIAIATIIAIFFGKLVFGGFGQNIFNPAGVGRAILGTSFAANKITDVLSGATPANTFASAGWLIKQADFAVYLEDFGGLKNLFFGLYEGAIGETSTILLIAVAIYLAITKVIDWRVPAVYVGVIFVGTTLIGVLNGIGIAYSLAFISTGGILFGAVFMLTDPVTNPNTRVGRIIFAGVAAILTVLIRLFASLPEGVVFSILIANMLTCVIEKITDGNQLDNVKKFNIAIPVYLVVLVAAIALCGTGLTKNSYKSIYALPEFDADKRGETIKITTEGIPGLDDSYTNSEVKSVDGNTYDVVAKGFNYEGGKNRFNIVVEDGVIKSMEITKFKDTEGIGDKIYDEGFLAQFVGKGLDDEVDTYASATFSSYSAIAAARRALEGAN